MDNNQFPIIYLQVFTGSIRSIYSQVNYIFVGQRGYHSEVDPLTIVQHGHRDGTSTLSEVKVDLDLLEKGALHVDEIKPITSDGN